MFLCFAMFIGMRVCGGLHGVGVSGLFSVFIRGSLTKKGGLVQNLGGGGGRGVELVHFGFLWGAWDADVHCVTTSEIQTNHGTCVCVCVCVCVCACLRGYVGKGRLKSWTLCDELSEGVMSQGLAAPASSPPAHPLGHLG